MFLSDMIYKKEQEPFDSGGPSLSVSGRRILAAKDVLVCFAPLTLFYIGIPIARIEVFLILIQKKGAGTLRFRRTFTQCEREEDFGSQGCVKCVLLRSH
ncbi:hypothetical protein CHISP_2575 [Chitinispirillum alkaliphilum]|nr:hypothetical protein CHISP_2575 [Chitinispirillum alkaliphilum]